MRVGKKCPVYCSENAFFTYEYKYILTIGTEITKIL